MLPVSEITRIALTGKMRSGKSTVAGMLRESNRGFYRISFGTAVKKYAEELFFDSPVYPIERFTRPCPFGGDDQILREVKPRRLFQDVGQALRALDPDIWIRHLELDMILLEGSRGVNGIIIEDLRQPNEYEWCRDKGFVIVKVVASDGEREARAIRAGDDFEPEDMTHETETHVDGFVVDYTIMNDGDMGELRRQVNELMREIIPAPAIEI